MGWTHDTCPGHEGFLVALVERAPVGAGLWRELAYPDDKDPRLAIRRIAVGCDCGWRSPRVIAPPGVEWHPFCVDAPEGLEMVARAIWHRHVRALGGLVMDPTGVVARVLLDALVDSSRGGVSCP